MNLEEPSRKLSKDIITVEDNQTHQLINLIIFRKIESDGTQVK